MSRWPAVTWRARQDDLILVTSHAYITQFPKFALWPQKFNFLHLCPLGVGRSLAALEPKFCLPHHDDIILMTSCAYIMLTSLISKNYTFAPKGKILTKMPPRWPVAFLVNKPSLSHHDDIILMTSCAYIINFPKFALLPQK